MILSREIKDWWRGFCAVGILKGFATYLLNNQGFTMYQFSLKKNKEELSCFSLGILYTLSAFSDLIINQK